MLDPHKTKYVCIHGHFYQPPRENPWLGEIELEASAAPHHDWNQRITLECYRANAAARLVDDQNRILTLRNNYRSLSFNFGPTLLTWIEKHSPWLYATLLDTDRDSCERLNGHGNAIAQVYTHLIMPLATRRDKMTQVLWGARDFQHRFGRAPEGMWLAETAVDLETLRVLAEAGIRFTVLSPFQAARWRPLEPGSPWHDAVGGTIPSGRPYRCDLGRGRSIDLFFYDALLAQSVAFERALEHSSRLVAGIEAAYRRRGTHTGPWLAHAATDGESYGHHFRFGDMALAAAFRDLEENPLVRITNYGAFLADFPPDAKVEILENSAWSCAHGLGRWQADCGCRVGGEWGWHQKWREPLREGLDQLRDRLADHYEREMLQLVRDPWQTRNDYIHFLLDPEGYSENFFFQQARRPLGPAERVRMLQLLELQRAAMFMFTSCGWFFDDISGLESAIVLRYAARAMQLASSTGAEDLEPAFLQKLAQAPSNLPEYRDGAAIYTTKVKPEVVSYDRVVANHAIRTLVRHGDSVQRLFCFQITPGDERELGPNPIPCVLGSVAVEDTRTGHSSEYLYGAAHFGGLDYRCSVKTHPGREEQRKLLKDLQKAAEEQNTVGMMRALDKAFGPTFFTLQDCFIDWRQELAIAVSRERLKIYTDFQRHVYEENRSLMKSLVRMGVRLPADLRGAVRRVLSLEAEQLVREILRCERSHQGPGNSLAQTDYEIRSRTGRLLAVMREARSWELRIVVGNPAHLLGEEMVATLSELNQEFSPRTADKLVRLMTLCQHLDAKPELWFLQTLYHQLVQKALEQPALAQLLFSQDGLLEQLDQFMRCRFMELLQLRGRLEAGMVPEPRGNEG